MNFRQKTTLCQRIWTSIVFIVISLGLISCQSKLSGIRDAAGVSSSGQINSAQGINGDWDGLFKTYGGQLKYIRLTIPEKTGIGENQSSGRMEGTVKISEVSVRRNSKKSQAQSFNVIVNFDDKLNSFSLSLADMRKNKFRKSWNEREISDIKGVFDQRENVLTGTAHKGQLFLFTRPGSFDALFTNVLKYSKGTRKKGSIWRAFKSGPSEEDIIKWTSLLEEENVGEPKDYLRRNNGVTVKLLFRDNPFKSIFGTAFDEASNDTIVQISETLKPYAIFRAGYHTNPVKGQIAKAILDKLIDKGDLYVSVKAQRHLLNWKNSQIKHLKAASEYPDPFGHIEKLKTQIALYRDAFLWPGEYNESKAKIDEGRTKIAYEKLKSEFIRTKESGSSYDLLNALYDFSSTYSEEFGYISDDQRKELSSNIQSAIDQVLPPLLSEYEKRLSKLGVGLSAIEKGNQWFSELTKYFRMDTSKNHVAQLKQKFFGIRDASLSQAQPEMIVRLNREFSKTPNNYSPKSDKQRIKVIKESKQLVASWFPLAQDRNHVCFQNVSSRRSELASKATLLLPPRKISDLGTYSLAATNRGKLQSHRAKIAPVIAKAGSLFYSNDLLKKVYPKPLTDAGFFFESDTAWAIFHGRFDQLNTDLYYRDDFQVMRAAKKVFSENPRFHHAFVSYVGLSSNRNGKKQVGPSQVVSWSTTKEDRYGNKEVTRKGWGKVNIPIVLTEYYEESYNFSKGSSSLERVYSKKGFLSLFKLLGSESMRNDPISGFSSFVRRGADGEIRAFGSDWEVPIERDIGKLLYTWPAESYALWQFQENIIRYLKGLPSVQEVLRYKL